MIDPDDVLRFWFTDHGREDWFKRSDKFDDRIRDRFLSVYEEAAQGGLDAWRDKPLGCVALCIVLDQFPRNLFRGDRRSYATDAQARAVTGHALERGFDRDPVLDDNHRLFLYMPLEHSEELGDQRACVALIREQIGDDEYVDYAERHLQIVERFGRFPHRNAILGRTDTDEEAEFLTQPGSGFG